MPSIAASTRSTGGSKRDYAGLIGRMAAHAGLMTLIAFAIMARGVLWTVARADRLSADRGPGLSAGRGPAARRRFARRARKRRCEQVSAIAQKDDERRPRHQPSPAFRRSTTAPRSPMPASPMSCSRIGASAPICARCFRRLTQRRSARSMRRVDRAAAAADPGHRQCRRLHHAGRIARRQHRFRQAAKHHQYHGRQRAIAKRAAARLDLVPRRRAATRASRSTASRRRRCTCRSTRCSRRWRPISARPMSTSSTNSAACSRSMRRPMRSSGCGRATSNNLTVRNQGRQHDPARHAA